MEYTSEVETKLFDYRTIEVKFTIGARNKEHNPATILRHEGANRKQNRIKLK